MCTWTNLKDDVFDWSRAQGPTGSSATGPTNDHTKGNRKYLYIYFCCDLNLSPFSLFAKKQKKYHLYPVFAEKEKASSSFFFFKVIHSLVCKQKHHPFFCLQKKSSSIPFFANKKIIHSFVCKKKIIHLFANKNVIHSFVCKQKRHPFLCLKKKVINSFVCKQKSPPFH